MIRVLIADDSVAILDSLDSLLNPTNGFQVVGLAGDGLEVVEKAKESLPDVVVCPIDLPIIDGGRLAEILRGNPRMRHASLIFLVKDELDSPLGIDGRDVTLASPWSSEDLLKQLDAVLERNARFGELRPDSEIQGKLGQISIADLLQVFSVNDRSGTLRISAPDGQRESQHIGYTIRRTF